MELKTKYEYTYFIYPYVIKESKYLKKIKIWTYIHFSHIELESICLEHLIIVKIRLNN